MNVGKYLDAHGYRDVAEWALDSDYQYDESTDLWTDEEGNIVDPYFQLIGAIESSRRKQYRVTFSVSVDVYANDERDAEDIAYDDLIDQGSPSWFVELLGATVDDASDLTAGLSWFPANEESEEDE